MGKVTHELAPGELDEWTGTKRDVGRAFQHREVTRQIRFYEKSGSRVHLWRAWRSARAFSEMPQELFDILAPHIDALADGELSGTTTRADQDQTRNAILFRYYKAMTRTPKPTKKAAREEVAQLTGTTAERIKQLVMEHEGRTERARYNAELRARKKRTS